MRGLAFLYAVSDQPQLFESDGDAVLLCGGADTGAAGFQLVGTVRHAVADAGHVGHLEVVFAVAEGHRRHTEKAARAKAQTAVGT